MLWSLAYADPIYLVSDQNEWPRHDIFVLPTVGVCLPQLKEASKAFRHVEICLKQFLIFAKTKVIDYNCYKNKYTYISENPSPRSGHLKEPAPLVSCDEASFLFTITQMFNQVSLIPRLVPFNLISIYYQT
ncbi:hypothetical protein F511_03406 [Dorcoceras hygrometricum]|uniref:Uncharacterized protein n=1 Tax=Dorcoceras hygrometricum TaxID=472368 RepID=A0A2Z7AUR5_9LAMI|nr:hypothetical protein F511_03406 [Dorcoceras hygrometricum]